MHHTRYGSAPNKHYCHRRHTKIHPNISPHSSALYLIHSSCFPHHISLTTVIQLQPVPPPISTTAHTQALQVVDIIPSPPTRLESLIFQAANGEYTNTNFFLFNGGSPRCCSTNRDIYNCLGDGPLGTNNEMKTPITPQHSSRSQ